MHSIIAVIQARMGSTRFPNKVIEPLNSMPIVLYLFEKIKRIEGLDVIIATTEDKKDNCLVAILEKYKVPFIRGSEQNVLSRFIQAAENSRKDYVIRICADNPLLSLDYLNKLISIWKENKGADYYSFSYKERPTVLSHFGIFAEIVKTSALKQVLNSSPQDFSYLEHVTNGVYSNPSVFGSILIDLTKELIPYEGIRLTIDTPEDYANVKSIVEAPFYSEDLSFEEIGNNILERSDLLNKMGQIIQNNSK